MIITQFKSNHPMMIFMIIIIAILLWSDGFSFYNQVEIPPDTNAPLYILMGEFFQQFKGWSVILSFLFMLLQAFMLNRIITEKNLVERNSWLPALMYILLMSSSFPLFGMHPVWFANFFLILAIDKMFEVFKDESVNIEIFNVAFLISVASLFYFPAIILVLLLVSALIIYFLLSIRELIATFAGMVLPYLFLALYYYWFDMLDDKVLEFSGMKIGVKPILDQIVPYGWATIIIIGVIAVVSVSRIFLGSVRDKPIRIRRRYNVLLAYLVLSIVSVVVTGPMASIHYGIIILPLSVFIAGFFQESKKVMLNEITFTILILIIIIGKLVRL